MAATRSSDEEGWLIEEIANEICRHAAVWGEKTWTGDPVVSYCLELKSAARRAGCKLTMTSSGFRRGRELSKCSATNCAFGPTGKPCLLS